MLLFLLLLLLMLVIANNRLRTITIISAKNCRRAAAADGQFAEIHKQVFNLDKLAVLSQTPRL